MPEITRVPRIASLLVLLALGLCCPPAYAVEKEKEKAALVSLRLSPNLEHDRATLQEALLGGIKEAGFQILPVADVHTRLAGHDDLRACTGESCLPDLARILGTRFLVFGEVASSRHQYELVLRVVDATDGRYLAAETIECRATDPCPPIAGGVAAAARTLGQRALSEISLAGRGRTPLPAPPVPSLPAAPKDEFAPSAAPAQPPKAASRVIANVLITSGAALIVASIAFFALDGRPTGCVDGVCLKRRETTIPAVLTGLLGLGLGGAGFAYRTRF